MSRNFGYSKNGGQPKLTITIETELLGESDVELFKNDDRIDAQADYVIEVIRNTPISVSILTGKWTVSRQKYSISYQE